ncbi:hypothetical protein [Deefgea piscis]|uniref:hypothetical protein n=1 Tax=Deefgea piscis TaxID=2739061 RepID=UPI001C80F44C|nr:hypothetical protein [Deefgea piscis]QZA80250.1 hypothetical protein K4H25_11980 [Deefgea piscis]
MVELKSLDEAGSALENWARYFMGFDGRAKSSGYAQYMSPEERAILGPADRPSNRVDEQAAMRVDAVLSVMLRRPELAMFSRLLNAHYLQKLNPAVVCRKERLPLRDYAEHVRQAVKAFQNYFNYWGLTPSKEIRKMSLNNLLPLRRECTPLRVLCCAQ